MEVLQTIWNALTTENETIINIISLPMLIIELTVSMLLFTTILNISATKKQKILYIALSAFFGILALFFIPTPFNTFINVLTCPILVYFIFKPGVLKSILAEFIPYIIFVLFGSIIVNLYTIISGIPTASFVNIPIHKLIFSVIMYLCCFFIYLFFRKYKINISLIDTFIKKSTRVLLINFCIGIVAICIQSYLTTFYNDYLPFYITFSSVFVLLIYFLISMYSLSRTNKLEKTTQDLENEKLYNKTITILYDNIRDFRHNFNNIVQALGGYISNNNMEGLKNYYKDVLNASQTSNNLAVLNPELINNPAIYSILSSKYYEAEELDIKMNFDIFLDLQNLNIKTYDLTLILGILLDNAIEAAKESAEKQINVIMRKDNKASRHLFIIENSYANKDVDIDRIFEKGYTSKEIEDNQSHGLGLWNVRKILKKNNNLNLFTNKDGKLFKQQLEIYS
ncbi:MAG: GHKL domain-containing protein [Clostridia bacterium]|nr:GHKL domain-containing protein [Clostridia bacterium]